MRRATVLVLFVLAACRTTRPPTGEAITPLAASSPSEAAQQLAALRAQFRGERSLIRLRLPRLSARGQLRMDSSGRMLMTVYSPIGSIAARLYVDGDHVIFLNDFEQSAWQGMTSDLAGTLSVFGNTRLAFLVIGLPPEGIDSATYAPTGMQTVRLADVVVNFEPPVYPPKRVVIDRGQQHIEIEHLQSHVDPEMLKPPEIPNDYRCCVLPQI